MYRIPFDTTQQNKRLVFQKNRQKMQAHIKPYSKNNDLTRIMGEIESRSSFNTIKKIGSLLNYSQKKTLKIHQSQNLLKVCRINYKLQTTSNKE